MDNDKYIGRLLDNRYEILEVIGSGGMAVVYKARCHRLNRLVAIKILKDDYLEDEDFRRRFHGESQAVAMFSHPNIVSVYDVSTSISLEADYIVMELIDGMSLKQYMEKKGVLNWKETLHFAIQIAKALEHAHSRGIVHRDIKPHNVMVLKNGSVKVTDFGIARMMSKGNTLTKEALGSVHYISPEQAKGGRVDTRSDLYSLGVVMYEMMTGKPPYDGDSPVSVAIKHIDGGAPMPSTVNPNIPDGLEQIIMKAMAHNIDDRYNTATQMLEDMDEFRKNPAMLFDYNTPPLDAVTKLKPPLTLNNPGRTTADRVADRNNGRSGGNQRRTPPPPPKERHRRQEPAGRNKTATIAIIACSLVILVAIIVSLVLLLNGGTTTEEKMKVPYLVGEVYDELPEYPDLVLVVVEEHNEQYPAGTIIHQEYERDTEVPKGTRMRIWVSMGSETVEVPMPVLSGFTEAEGRERMSFLSLKVVVRVKSEYSKDVPIGMITRTEPVAGEILEEGQIVIFYISRKVMPDLKNMPLSQAEDTMEAFELDKPLIVKYENDNEVEKGKVIRSLPETGEELSWDDEVTIVVSNGPEKTVMPNLKDRTLEQAKSDLAGNGFIKEPIVEYVDGGKTDVVIGQSHPEGKETPVNAEITLQVTRGPATKDVELNVSKYTQDGECLIRVFRDETQVFSETVAQGQATIVLSNQSGWGTVTYVITVDDTKESCKVEFSAADYKD